MTAVGQQHIGPKLLQNLVVSVEKAPNLTGRETLGSARLEAVGMSVRRTPLTVRSMASGQWSEVGFAGSAPAVCVPSDVFAYLYGYILSPSKLRPERSPFSR